MIKHWLAVARNASTPDAVFRSALAELGRLLIYELLRDWAPTVDLQVESPCGTADATVFDPNKPIKVTSFALLTLLTGCVFSRVSGLKLEWLKIVMQLR